MHSMFVGSYWSEVANVSLCISCTGAQESLLICSTNNTGQQRHVWEGLKTICHVQCQGVLSREEKPGGSRDAAPLVTPKTLSKAT